MFVIFARENLKVFLAISDCHRVPFQFVTSARHHSLMSEHDIYTINTLEIFHIHLHNTPDTGGPLQSLSGYRRQTAVPKSSHQAACGMSSSEQSPEDEPSQPQGQGK